MSETWKVSRFADSVRQVKSRSVNPIWGDLPHLGDHYFDTEAEACAFVVERAESDLRKAEASVKKERARLARIRKKFGAKVPA